MLLHCVKSVQISSFFWSVSSRIWIYLSVFSSNAGKYGPGKTLYLDTFHTVLVRQDLSRLIKRPSFISRQNFLSSWAHTLKWSSEGVWLHDSKWSLVCFCCWLNVINQCLRWIWRPVILLFYNNKSPCRDHTEICTQHQKQALLVLLS